MEVQVALVVFGIGLGGLCPLVVMQSRQFKNYQSRLDPRTAYYLVPSADIWARKLGASASLLTQVPAGQLAASPPPANDVIVQSVQKSLVSETVTVAVSVQAVTP